MPKSDPPWKPSLDPGIDLLGLPLTPEEGFVASRLDGATDAHGLAIVTGLPPERIEAALEKLASFGAVARPSSKGPPSPARASPPRVVFGSLPNSDWYSVAVNTWIALRRKRMPMAAKNAGPITGEV